MATPEDRALDQDDGKGYRVVHEVFAARALETCKQRFGIELPTDPFSDLATFTNAGGVSQTFKVKEGFVIDPETWHGWGTKQAVVHSFKTRGSLELAMANKGNWGMSSAENIGINTKVDIGKNSGKCDVHFLNWFVTEMMEAATSKRPFPMKDGCWYGVVLLAHETNLQAQHVGGELGRNSSADAGGVSILFRQSVEAHAARAGLQIAHSLIAYVQAGAGNSLEITVMEPKLMDTLLAREHSALIAGENGSLNEFMGHCLPRGPSLGERNGTHFLHKATGRLYHTDDADTIRDCLSDDFGCEVAYHNDYNNRKQVPGGALLASPVVQFVKNIPRGHERNAGHYLLKGPDYHHGPTTFENEQTFGDTPEWQCKATMIAAMHQFERSIRLRLARVAIKAPDG